MTRLALISLVASGCFYTDSINQRPSLDIKRPSSDPIYRTDKVALEAIANDPDGDFVTFDWRAYACTDPTDCDQAPFHFDKGMTTTITVPAKRIDPLTGQPGSVPVEAVLVLLDGMDDYGATARPTQQLLLTVDDHPPELTLRKDSRYGYVIGTPINVFAAVGDPDDTPADATVTWQVFSPPSNPAYTLVDLTVMQNDPDHLYQYGKTFTPNGIGQWTIQVTATDHLGTATTQAVMIVVTADQPPCLSQLSPIVPPPGNTLPMSQPTLFAVNVVKDDLDPYPTVPSDPLLGTTRFTWSLLPPGAGTRQALTGITGNALALDPSSYNPGDILELRVEIYDRNNTPITCADGNATCSVISDPQCVQRQTWRVEVR